MKKKCKFCHAEFEPKSGKAKFCSTKCRVYSARGLVKKANLMAISNAEIIRKAPTVRKERKVAPDAPQPLGASLEAQTRGVVVCGGNISGKAAAAEVEAEKWEAGGGTVIRFSGKTHPIAPPNLAASAAALIFAKLPGSNAADLSKANFRGGKK